MKTNHTVILSKDEAGLLLEFVVNDKFTNDILQKRYFNKSHKIITLDQLPPLFSLYPFCYDVSDWNNLTFYIKDVYKAKDIQKDAWRQARKPILEKLDVEYMRADEQGNTALKQQIIVQKQQLRDVTNTLLPDDLEGIKNTWPSILNS